MFNSIKNTLFFIIGGFVCLSAILVGAGVYSSQNINQSAAWVNHTHKAITEANGLIKLALDAETGQRGYLLTQNEKYLIPYKFAIKEYKQHFQNLLEQTSDNTDQTKKLQRLDSIVQLKFSELDSTIILSKSKRHEEAIQLVKTDIGKKYQVEIRSLIKEFIEEEERLLNKRKSDFDAAQRFSHLLIISSIILLLLLGGISTRKIITNIIIPILKLDSAGRALEKKKKFRAINITGKSELANFANTFNKIATEYIEKEESLKSQLEIAEKASETEKKTKEAMLNLMQDLNIEKTKLEAEKENVEASNKELTATKNNLLQTTKDLEEKLNALEKAKVKEQRTRVAMISLMEDLNLEKKNLNTEKKNIDTILSTSPIGMLKTNINGDIVYLNKSVREIFGYEESSLLGQNIKKLMPTNEKGNHDKHFHNFNRSEDLQLIMANNRDIKAIKADGSNIYVEVTIRKIITNSNIEFLVSVTDVSERKEHENAIARNQAKLEASNKELEQFAYVASHDLQEPIRVVQSFVDRLNKSIGERLNEKETQYLNFVLDASDRMKVLVQDLLKFSRVSKIEALEKKNIDLNELFKAIQFDLSTTIQEQNAIIKYDDLPVIKGNKQQLYSLFQNLTSNALKYRKADVAPEVEIIAKEFDKEWKISVTDNGIGIGEEYFEKIFVIFQRLHNKSKYSGTGIGLALCKKIVEQHSGEIRLESEENVGSTFIVTLPKDKDATS